MLAEARKTAGEIVHPSLAIDRVPVTKMCGSGNDFIVLDNRNGIIEEDDAAAFARRVCRRRMAVGADGLVLIERPTTSSAQFRWRYLNADGSEVEMCGNGAMCGARFAYLNGIAPASCVFETPSGLVHASVNPDRARNDVRIAIADSGALQRDLLLDIAGQTYRLHAVAVGVPHAVLMRDPGVPDWPHGDFVAWGRSVRHHPRFAPAGTNVDAITIDADGLVRMRTYERGVEDETLACGTGAVASAIVAGAFGLTAPPVTVMTASDLPLTVDFTWDGKSARDVSLAGTARVVMSGEIWPEALV